MAEIRSVNVKKDELFLNLKVSSEEYEFLKQTTSEIALIPTGQRFMSQPLTTGKLGNSTRLMLPKKSLDRLEVKKMDRKVPGRIFKIEGNVYLLARISGKRKGVPVFEGDNDG